MERNDPGREPEPTDAELLRDFEAADVRLSNACENCMDFSEDGEPTDPEYLDAEYEWKLCSERREARGREYLSGARPMQDAPDESVKFWKDGWHNLDQDNRALTARVAELEALVRAVPAGLENNSLFCDGPDWFATRKALLSGKEPTDAE